MRLSAPIHRLKHRAKLLARRDGIPLHEALDRVAREEGFSRWSLLSAQFAVNSPSKALLSRLANGDLLLLGARPGHGKTLLGLRLLLDSAGEGRRAAFFTLEYTEREARRHLRSMNGGADERAGKLEILTSDDISADVVIEHLSGSPRGTVAVIDYLQILDQQRNKPALSDPMRALRDFAGRTGVILGFMTQIDRSFDPEARPVPDIQDVRLPNRIDLGVFSKACFLHDGEVRFQDVA